MAIRSCCLPAAKILCTLCLLWFSPLWASEYLVKPGDTLSRIANQHLPVSNQSNRLAIKTFADQIVRNNLNKFPEANPDRLFSGMKLKIPEFASGISSTPVSATKEANAPLSSSIAHADIIGHITTLNGQGWLLHPDESRQKLYTGLGVHQGDIVSTSYQSDTKIDFLDGSSISLNQNSQIEINEYHWNAQKKSGRSILKFLQGAFRAVSGLIAKQTPDNYSVITQVATIGVRGTYFGARMCKQQTCVVQLTDNNITLSEGIYIGVLQGKIVSKSKGQETVVSQGEMIYQKNALAEAKFISNIPGLIFSAVEINKYAAANNTSRKSVTSKRISKNKAPFYSAFLRDSQGNIIKNNQGNCIRSSIYRKNHYVSECK